MPAGIERFEKRDDAVGIGQRRGPLD